MKTKLLLIVGYIAVFIAINACSKERINACIDGEAFACQLPIPNEETLLDDGQLETDAMFVESDSTLAVSKLPVRKSGDGD
jgi:hypothetical protein